MFPIAFWTLLTINVVTGIYIAINRKEHAKPWRLFALGIGFCILIFWIQYFVGSPKDTDSELMKNVNMGVSLLASTITAMSGALLGTAVTNRAMFLHEDAVAKITHRLEQADVVIGARAKEIQTQITDQSHRLELSELLDLVKQRDQLISVYAKEKADLIVELKALRHRP